MKSYASLAEALSAIDPRRERPFRCHAHDDHQASASVNVVKGLWYCYACGAHGKADGSWAQTDTQQLREEVFALLQGAEGPPSEELINLYTGTTVHPYWLSRFSEDAAHHFELGYDPTTEQPMYPIRDAAGALIGWVRRNPDGVKPKYSYSMGLKVSDLLFNYSPQRRDVVYLVEGAMDVVACWEAGIEAFGIFGSVLSDAQCRLIAKVAPSTVVLAFDNDKAGREATAHARVMLPYYDVVPLNWSNYAEFNDIAEMPRSLRANALTEGVAP